MHIWVDADACPNTIKEILFRVAIRVNVPLTLVANQPLRTPPSTLIRSVQVASGFDIADNYIVQMANLGDVVITADIPLAAEAIAKGAYVLNPRGERYTPDTVRQRLVMRDLMDELRGSGVQTKGPPPLNQRDLRQFANALDRLLAQVIPSHKP
jgi:uncharacterized protein YaiI (UPF0178 family)